MHGIQGQKLTANHEPNCSCSELSDGFPFLLKKAQNCRGQGSALCSFQPDHNFSPSPHLLNFSYTKLLTVYQTIQTYVNLRIFADTNSCAWDNVPLDGHVLAPVFPSELCSKAMVSGRLSLTTVYKIAASSIIHQYLLLPISLIPCSPLYFFQSAYKHLTFSVFFFFYLFIVCLPPLEGKLHQGMAWALLPRVYNNTHHKGAQQICVE